MSPSTWIFQGNPDRFDLSGYLAAGLPRITWTVKRYADRMVVGDRVFLWRSGGSQPGRDGTESGILASAHIDSAPWEGADHVEAHPFWREAADADRVETRVWLVVDRVADKRGIIRRDWLLDDPLCRDLLILTQPAGTNYPVEPGPALRLQALWARTGEDWNRAEVVAALRTYHMTYGGPLSKTAGSPIAELAILLGRAVGGAYNKLLNFRAIDPRDARKGLDSTSQMDHEVWTEFYGPEAETLGWDALDAEFQRLWRAPEPSTPDIMQRAHELERQVRENARRSLADLMAAYATKPPEPRPPSTRLPALVFDRSALVVAIARKRAGDRCEVPGCDYQPFITTAGESYVEVHHIQTLATGGEDTIDNAACLCPTHHRELHYGRDAEALKAQLLNLRTAERSA